MSGYFLTIEGNRVSVMNACKEKSGEEGASFQFRRRVSSGSGMAGTQEEWMVVLSEAEAKCLDPQSRKSGGVEKGSERSTPLSCNVSTLVQRSRLFEGSGEVFA